MDPVDLSPGLIIEDKSFSQRLAAALARNGRELWVLNRSGGNGGGSISIVSLGTREVVEVLTLPEFSSPEHTVVTSDGNYAYIADGGNGTVSVTLTATRRRLLTLDVGGVPSFLWRVHGTV